MTAGTYTATPSRSTYLQAETLANRIAEEEDVTLEEEENEYEKRGIFEEE